MLIQKQKKKIMYERIDKIGDRIDELFDGSNDVIIISNNAEKLKRLVPRDKKIETIKIALRNPRSPFILSDVLGKILEKNGKDRISIMMDVTDVGDDIMKKYALTRVLAYYMEKNPYIQRVVVLSDKDSDKEIVEGFS